MTATVLRLTFRPAESSEISPSSYCALGVVDEICLPALGFTTPRGTLVGASVWNSRVLATASA